MNTCSYVHITIFFSYKQAYFCYLQKKDCILRNLFYVSSVSSASGGDFSLTSFFNMIRAKNLQLFASFCLLLSLQAIFSVSRTQKQINLLLKILNLHPSENFSKIHPKSNQNSPEKHPKIITVSYQVTFCILLFSTASDTASLNVG